MDAMTGKNPEANVHPDAALPADFVDPDIPNTPPNPLPLASAELPTSSTPSAPSTPPSTRTTSSLALGGRQLKSPFSSPSRLKTQTSPAMGGRYRSGTDGSGLDSPREGQLAAGISTREVSGLGEPIPNCSPNAGHSPSTITNKRGRVRSSSSSFRSRTESYRTVPGEGTFAGYPEGQGEMIVDLADGDGFDLDIQQAGQGGVITLDEDEMVTEDVFNESPSRPSSSKFQTRTQIQNRPRRETDLGKKTSRSSSFNKSLSSTRASSPTLVGREPGVSMGLRRPSGPLRLDTSDRMLGNGNGASGLGSAKGSRSGSASNSVSGMGAFGMGPASAGASAGSQVGRLMSPLSESGEKGIGLGIGVVQAQAYPAPKLGTGSGQAPTVKSSPSLSSSPSSRPTSIFRAISTFASSMIRLGNAIALPAVSVPGGRRRVKPMHFVIVAVLFWALVRMSSGGMVEDEVGRDNLESGTAGTNENALGGGALANRQALAGDGRGARSRSKHTLDEAYEDPTSLAEGETLAKLEAHHEEAELRRGKAIRGEKHGRGEIERELAEREKAGSEVAKGTKNKSRVKGKTIKETKAMKGAGARKKKVKSSQIDPASNEPASGLSGIGGYAKNLIVGAARGNVGHGAEVADAGGSNWDAGDDMEGLESDPTRNGGRSLGSKWTTPFASTGYGILQSLPGFKSALSALSPLTGSKQFSISGSDEADIDELEDEPTIYRPQPEIFMQHFPGPDPDRADYREWNHAAMRDLYACLAVDNCGVNQGKVALLAAHWIQMAVVQGHAQGEGVWGRSMYNALKGLGYTVILATTWEEALYRYRQMPELTKIVVRNEAGHCHYDKNCVKSEDNPTGIPAWKIFDFEFFPGQSTSMLKDQWLLSPDLDDHPEMNRDIQYIGYSIEEDCETRAVTPLEDRDERAWLFAKELRYLHDENDFAWDLEWFPKVSEELGLGIVGALRPDPEDRWDLNVEGVKNLGTIGATQFQHELGTSRALLGVGAPYLSPSPFVALCQGVPFINPIMKWDENDPENRLKWDTQQPTLRWYDPPFVYNVKKGDYDGFRDALRDAMKATIPRTILPHMKEAALRERMMNLMETDWQARAEELLEKRKKEGGDTWIM